MQEQRFITPEMKMGDIVKKYPEAIEVLLSYGLHCVGCGVSYIESLQDGASAHGMTQEEIAEMIAAVNKTINEAQATGNVVNLTNKAAEKVKALLARENKSNHGIRIDVVKGGCAGQNYSLSFDDEVKPEDEVITEKGVKLFVNKEHLPLLQGVKIDFVDSLQGSGFKISNPNAQKTCGCGQSFH